MTASDAQVCKSIPKNASLIEDYDMLLNVEVVSAAGADSLRRKNINMDSPTRVLWFKGPLTGAARQQAERLGIDIDRARAALEIVYSEPVGNRLLPTEDARLVAPLVLRPDEWYHGTARILLLGADLSECRYLSAGAYPDGILKSD